MLKLTTTLALLAMAALVPLTGCTPATPTATPDPWLPVYPTGVTPALPASPLPSTPPPSTPVAVTQTPESTATPAMTATLPPALKPTPTPTQAPPPTTGTAGRPVRQEYRAELLAPTGAALHHVRLDPQDARVVYAVGNRVVWKSNDGGDRWEVFKSLDLAQDVAISPRDSRTVYVATRQAIHRTRDGGATWEVLPGVEGARTMLINPAQAEEIYAGGTGAVNYSADGGATWRRLAIPGASAALWDIDVTFDRPPGQRVIMAGENGSVTLWRSADGGGAWSKVHTSGGGRTPVKIAPGNPQLVYTTKGVSTDGGITWREAPVAWGIGVHPQDHRVAYYGDSGAFYLTTDGGVSFVDAAPQINYTAGELEDFAFDPATDTVYLAASSLYRATGARSGRVNFADASRGMYGLDFTDLKSTPWAVWASSDTQGVHRSEDRGVTWRQDILGTFGLDSIRSLAPDPTDARIIYLGHESVVYKSVDGGRSWAMLVSARFPQVTVDPERPGTVYYGTSEDQLYRSQDGGATWKLLNQAGRRVFIHPSDSATIYTISAGTLFRSGNRGDGWSRVGPVQGSNLYILPSQPNTMFAPADTAGMYRSDNGGATWTKQTIQPRRPRRVLETADGSLWLAASDGGVYRSLDRGGTWELVVSMEALHLAPDPMEADSVYVASQGERAAVWWLHPAAKTLPAKSAPPALEPAPATVLVDSCRVLDRSNTVYLVTRNLTPVGAGSCFLIPQGVHDITLDGVGHSAAFGSPTILGDSVENVAITNLTLVQSGEDGHGNGAVLLSNVKGLKVTGNTIITNAAFRGEHGIVVSGVFTQGVEIAGNHITVARFSTGIVVNGEGIVVRGNVVASGGPGGNGILVGSAPGAVIENNQITAGGSGAYFGIQVRSSPGAAVTGNRVAGVYSRGGSAMQVLDSPSALIQSNVLP